MGLLFIFLINMVFHKANAHSSQASLCHLILVLQLHDQVCFGIALPCNGKFCSNSSTRKSIYKAVWELILDVDGLGKKISDTVEKVFRWLSSIELPMPTQSQAALVAHAETRGDEEVEIPKASARKRRFVEMSMQDGAETLANISIVQVAVGSESVTAPGTNGTTFGTNQTSEEALD